MFRYLFPCPIGRVAADHDRAGIGPTLVASDRRRSGTGPPRQVHRIRALVWVYCTTIQIYKYKIIQKKFKWRWGSDSPSGTAARNKSARPHSRAPEECLSRRIESGTQPLPRAVVQSGQPGSLSCETVASSRTFVPTKGLLANLIQAPGLMNYLGLLHWDTNRDLDLEDNTPQWKFYWPLVSALESRWYSFHK